MPLQFNQLKPLGVYNIHSVHFNANYKAKLVSFDTTGLNRNIAYFQRLGSETTFAIWDFEFNYNYIVNN